MGFYNVLEGDAPYSSARRRYAMSDNFHQAVQGGTGANHIMLGTGDAIWFTDGQGHAAVPPADEIENPNAQPRHQQLVHAGRLLGRLPTAIAPTPSSPAWARCSTIWRR